MSLILGQLKRISTFFYILVFLFVINLLFNLNYSWYGVSFIVRSYLFVFSFYLIFNIAEIDIGEKKKLYRERTGAKGEFILFLQTRIVPFLIIYTITILFTLIDYVREPNWPFNPILNLMNGRYSNLLYYSLFLLHILKIKRGPNVAIPIFLAISVLFFALDKLVYSIYPVGSVISLFKLAKFVFFFFFLVYEFFDIRKKLLRMFFVPLSFGIVSYLLIVSFLTLTFRYSETASYAKSEAGQILLKMGYKFPLRGLMQLKENASDQGILKKLFLYSRYYDVMPEYSRSEWENLLFSGTVQMADMIAEYITHNKIPIDYKRLITFAEKKSKKNESNLPGAMNIITLAAQNIGNNYQDFIARLEVPNVVFQLWIITVLGEHRNFESIPVLLQYLVGIDQNLSESAYISLKQITDLDPKESLNKSTNSPDVYIAFRNFYLQKRSK